VVHLYGIEGRNLESLALRQLFLSPWFLLPIFAAFLLQPLSADYVGIIKAHNEAVSSRVLLLTAHPDDECMFFAPTLLALKNRQQVSRDVYSLCLSIGDADGLGETRAIELGKSLDLLGIDEHKRWILDIPCVHALLTYSVMLTSPRRIRELKDNITLSWGHQAIANVVRPYVVDHKIDTVSV
jgi:N-acetylglucosaminylphosphatidylinositol deacetylase